MIAAEGFTATKVQLFRAWAEAAVALTEVQVIGKLYNGGAVTFTATVNARLIAALGREKVV